MARLRAMRSFLVALLAGCVLAGAIVFLVLRPERPVIDSTAPDEPAGAVPVGPAPLAPATLPPRPEGIVSFTIAFTADTGSFLENCG